MEITTIYNRLIYRDILGYCLPGAILVASALIAISPISINGRAINPIEPLSASKLVVLLGLGFVTAHIIAVLPRKFLRTENKAIKRIERAFENYRIKTIEPILIEVFENIFGNDTWHSFDCLRKSQLILRWIKAKNLQSDMLNRIESIRIFFENSVFILPLAMFILAINVNIAHLSREISTGVFIVLGILLMMLSLLGFRGLEILEEREIVFTFVDHYMSNKANVQIRYKSAEK